VNPHIDLHSDARFMGLHAVVKGLTITSIERQFGLYQAILYLHENEIAGDIVECGVWKGGSAMLAALTLLELGDRRRTLWLCDTYEGMTPHGEHDQAVAGVGPEHFEGSVLAVPLEEVFANVATTGYPMENVAPVVGDLTTDKPYDYMPSKIALLRLDTDWYESTKIELEMLYPLVVPGGVVIADDYGHWLGQGKAVDEYFEADPPRPLLNRLDYSGVMWVKP
jgi:hypothetical protein